MAIAKKTAAPAKKTPARKAAPKPAAEEVSESNGGGFTILQFAKELNELTTRFIEANGDVPANEVVGAATRVATKAASKAKAAAAEEEDTADEAEAETDERWDELNAMRLPALRALAKKRGFPEDEVAAADKPTLVEGIWNDEKSDEDAEAEGDEDEADETEEDESEEGEYTREDLEAMSLAELRKLAKESGVSAADLRGQDVDGIVALLLPEEDEAEEDAEGEEEDEGEYYTEEQLGEMSLAELKALCKEYGIKVPRGADEATLIELLTTEEDEEE